MSQPLPRSAPEPLGIDPAAVTRFIGAIEASGLEMHSLMLLRHGSVAAEGWWQPYTADKPHMLFSLSKSFTSTAVGFAVAEGLLSVDDPVLRFFPEAPEKPGRYWPEMRVRHLLSMSTGHARDTTGFMRRRRDGDWVRAFLSRPLRYRPGTHFLYNTGATYMLSVIISRVSGQKLVDYLTPRLFAPLGIEGAAWEECPRGYNTGGFGLSLRTEDIARFGQFLLQRGMWLGRQLLPAAWVDDATRKHVENGTADGTSDWGMGYGYQFWRCIPGCYRGDGAFGQYCIVVPQLDVVLAITSGLNDMQAVLRRVWDILLPAIGEPLPDDPAARAEMEQRLAGLHYAPPALRASSPLAAAVSSRPWKLDRNREHRRTTTLRFNDADGTCEQLSRYGGRQRGKVTGAVYGLNRWVESTVETPQGQMNIAAAYGWEDDTTLVLTTRYLHTPFTVTERFSFTDDTVEISRRPNLSLGPLQETVMRGKRTHAGAAGI